MLYMPVRIVHTYMLIMGVYFSVTYVEAMSKLNTQMTLIQSTLKWSHNIDNWDQFNVTQLHKGPVQIYYAHLLSFLTN